MLYIINYTTKSATGIISKEKLTARSHNLTDSARAQAAIKVDEKTINLFIQINRVSPVVINGHLILLAVATNSKIDQQLPELVVNKTEITIVEWPPVKLPDDLGTITLSVTVNPTL